VGAGQTMYVHLPDESTILPKVHVGMKTFGRSCEDVYDNWRLRIKGATG